MEKLSLNLSEAAEILGVSRNYLYQHLLHEPGFPQIRLGKRTLIPVEALKKWLEERSKHM